MVLNHYLDHHIVIVGFGGVQYVEENISRICIYFVEWHEVEKYYIHHLQ
ncbi:MAG: hypothetical protein M9958_00410 [Chitinophagales bacterium]|nr:hypothetical protein [Chitinophagales bacterium]